MNLEGGQVEFLRSSEEINTRAHEYWPLVMDIARRNKLPRILRCCQIMGRSEQDELSAAQIFYLCMQCADVDICQLGMDQRKVNVLAREYCDDIKRKNKPVILFLHDIFLQLIFTVISYILLHTNMLPGLQEGQEKMSKSDPSSSMYMEDEEAKVNVKIKKAFCPPKVVEKNPCLVYLKYIIFPWFNEFEVETFKSFEELSSEYESRELHPRGPQTSSSKSTKPDTTDPQNSDYIVESGATRNFEPWRAEDKVIDEEKNRRNVEEMGDAMKSLENRTLDSKREMDILATLDEMKSMKSRHAPVSVDAMLEALQHSNEAKERKLKEEDEALMKAVFKLAVIRRIDDEDIDDEEDFPMFPFDKEGTSVDHSKNRKVSKEPCNPIDSLTNGTVLDSSNSKGNTQSCGASDSGKFIFKSSTVTVSILKKPLPDSNSSKLAKEEPKN
ncbi:tyrosine--tRNA ligase 1, cytoplasmic [Olea europaea subsp. europaea]|uniref:tyrosine--tRNA ligase n=1 Tax=Olea europaea subsp. europaea TaxID=158383 RepID=A0A8S0V9H8_OLEEU|nr:tyrosine--tRNA ligase 1, cytoplasmic [Olea europaea subsp. europaea]